VTKDRLDDILHKGPASRRKVLRTLLIGTFAAPVVASFPMDGRSSVAQAQIFINSTHS
jgi:hypothetical protein